MKTKISHRTIPDPTGRTRSLTSCVIFLLILYQKTEIKSTLKNSQVDPRDKGVYFPQSFRSLDYDTILHQSWNIVNPEAADTAVPPVSKANTYTHLCMSLMFIEEHRQLLEGVIFRSRLNKKGSEVLGVPGQPNGGAAPLFSESGDSLSDIYNNVNPGDVSHPMSSGLVLSHES